MKFDHPELEASFEIHDPEDWSVGRVLQYDSALELSRSMDFYNRVWRAAKPMVFNWECDFVSPDDNLEDINDMKAVEIIKWASLVVFSARRSLDRSKEGEEYEKK